MTRSAAGAKGFNLSDWALHHTSLIWYLMIVASVAGVMSYLKLGREEDPAFTIKTMVIQAQWPGASVEDTINQVTERIEKKLEELESLDFTKSISTPGQTTVYVNLRPTTKAAEVAPTWQRVRNMIGDIRGQFPQGVVGPFFNDRFGDVFGSIYAFTADGLSQRQLRDYVEDVRARLLTLPAVGKVDLIGAQDEVIYLEFSTREMAALGLDRREVIATLRAQNAVAPSGVIQAGPERISIRVGGQFTSEESLRAINLRVNDRFFRLSDVARISRGTADPMQPLFRVNGREAIGLAIGMKAGGNLLAFGAALKERMERIITDLPVGVGVHLVADQAAVVDKAVGGFTKALFEAVAIVLLVSFVSLGMRAGFVVSLSIPLVLAITFLAMELMGVSLQRISLGALIIALGLLVDDAMIAIEMMVARLEAGDSLAKAATAVYTSTAFPMLTGTLVTIAGFMPVGLNDSAAGEYTYTLFLVILVSLLVSWVVAVLFAPLLGVTLLPATLHRHEQAEGGFGSIFRGLLHLAMRWRWLTIALTLGLFGLSLWGMGFVQKQFFPSSERPEIILDWTLPHSATIAETKAQMDRFEAAALAGDADIQHWSSYVGQGAPRFLLTFDVQPANPYFGQMVVVTRDLAARERVKAKIAALLDKDFLGTDVFVHNLDLGPPVGRPVQYRISGPDLQKVRTLAQELAGTIGDHPRLGRVVYDWMEPARVARVDLMQDKARQLGVSSEDIATTLASIVGGASVTQVRDDIYLVNVVGRAVAGERSAIETIPNLQLPGRNGQSVPLAALASFRYGLEQPVVWRRARLPTITLKASVTGGLQPATVVEQLRPKVEAFAARLPAGYAVVAGGSVEESAKAQNPIIAVVPLMVFTILTILMLQLQSFQRLFLVVAVAPLGLIGVVAALAPSGAPLGFVAVLGVLALVGILIRNSVILVVQIDELRQARMPAWQAVIEATEGRMRPILLTAAAASLALIPIAHEVFWGPMAYAMMGGIIAGTLLTLLFLPALYVAWFRIKPPKEEAEA